MSISSTKQDMEHAIAIREARREDILAIARVNVDTWHTTYRGLVPDDYLERRTYTRQEQVWQQIFDEATPRSGIHVAEDAGHEVVGYAAGGPHRDENLGYTSELYAIYVLEAFQRRGIGPRLVGTIARRLAREGMHSMMLWVFSANPARHFYEKLGGQVIGEKAYTLGNATLIGTGYGWNDTAALQRLVDE